MTNSCSNCRFWSPSWAERFGRGTCMNESSPEFDHEMLATDKCDEFKEEEGPQE